MERIEMLLVRYFDGETSLEEERELRAFFRSASSLPSEWEPYRDIFGYFDDQRTIVSARKPSSRRHRIIRMAGWASAAAACAAMVFLLDFEEPISSVPSSKLAQTVKVERVEDIDRVAPQVCKVEQRCTARKNIRKAKKAEASTLVKPIRKKSRPIEALKEVDGVDKGLQKLEVIREVKGSLSPLSSLAYLQEYFPNENK